MCAMFGDCYMFMKILCSLCTEIDKSALKYLARYTGLNSIFDWTAQPQFSYCLSGLTQQALTVDTLSRLQNRICFIESQEKENKVLCIANEEMGAANLTLDNCKS